MYICRRFIIDVFMMSGPPECQKYWRGIICPSPLVCNRVNQDYTGAPESHPLLWKWNKPKQLALETAYDAEFLVLFSSRLRSLVFKSSLKIWWLLMMTWKWENKSERKKEPEILCLCWPQKEYHIFLTFMLITFLVRTMYCRILMENFILLPGLPKRPTSGTKQFERLAGCPLDILLDINVSD